MSHTTPVGETRDKASFLVQSRKAIAGGIAAVVAAEAPVAPVLLTTDGVTVVDFWIILGTAVGAFVVGFAGVWFAPANAPAPAEPVAVIPAEVDDNQIAGA